MRWLRIILLPIALIYGAVVHLRNFLYDIHVFRFTSFLVPVIAIGNLSVGGTGKTPMVDFLLGELKKDFKMAILSRGYKRKSHGFQLGTTDSTVEQLGDEPFQLLQRHPNITVAVHANRTEGIRKLMSIDDFDLILLDDAFQHRKVKPHFSILLTTYDNPYSRDYFLPMGSLRDSRNQAKRADIIVVTKCPQAVSENQKNRLNSSLKPQQGQALLFSKLQYEGFFTDGKKQVQFKELNGKKCALVTAIANPLPLVAYLNAVGLKFEHLRFADHHFFTNKDLNSLKNFDIILTTEKDYTRLQGRIENTYFLRVSHEFFGDGKNRLLQSIKKVVKPD